MSVHYNSKNRTYYFRKRVKNIDGTISNKKIGPFKSEKEAKKAELLYSEEINHKSLKIDVLSKNFIDIEVNRIKSSSVYAKQLTINKYIIPYFKDKTLDKITALDIARWQKLLLNEKLTIDRINRIIVVFSQLFEHAILYFNYTQNPVKKVGKLKDHSIKKEKIQVWTVEEFEKFIAYVNNTALRTLYYLLFYTGLRIGEALALTWNDINLIEKTIDINKSVGYGKFNVSGYVVTSPKTKNSYRTIQIPDKLLMIILNYKENLTVKNIKYKNSDFIFGITKPLSETNIRRIKDAACEASGVKKIRIHDFRHSHASYLISIGVDPLYVKERLGHDDISTTLNIYSHLFDKKRKSIENIIKNL